VLPLPARSLGAKPRSGPVDRPTGAAGPDYFLDRLVELEDVDGSGDTVDRTGGSVFFCHRLPGVANDKDRDG
jgi:hypothetical protein